MGELYEPMDVTALRECLANKATLMVLVLYIAFIH